MRTIRRAEPQAAILGSPDLAVKVGAPINLTCVISQSPDQLQFVFWYRDERMINYDLERERRGKIVMSKVSQRQDTIASNLQIFRSKPSDSANYTCAPSGAKSTSIYVHVLEGKWALIGFQARAGLLSGRPNLVPVCRGPFAQADRARARAAP